MPELVSWRLMFISLNALHLVTSHNQIWMWGGKLGKAHRHFSFLMHTDSQMCTLHSNIPTHRHAHAFILDRLNCIISAMGVYIHLDYSARPYLNLTSFAKPELLVGGCVRRVEPNPLSHRSLTYSDQLITLPALSLTTLSDSGLVPTNSQLRPETLTFSLSLVLHVKRLCDRKQRAFFILYLYTCKTWMHKILFKCKCGFEGDQVHESFGSQICWGLTSHVTVSVGSLSMVLAGKTISSSW